MIDRSLCFLFESLSTLLSPFEAHTTTLFNPIIAIATERKMVNAFKVVKFSHFKKATTATLDTNGVLQLWDKSDKFIETVPKRYSLRTFFYFSKEGDSLNIVSGVEKLPVKIGILSLSGPVLLYLYKKGLLSIVNSVEPLEACIGGGCFLTFYASTSWENMRECRMIK